MQSEGKAMEVKETRYCFSFHYDINGCFCTGADTLNEARKIFKDYINSYPETCYNERRRKRLEEKYKKLQKLDVNLIEPEIY
jgi:hypothetical protein